MGDFKKIATAQIDISPLTGLEIFLSISPRANTPRCSYFAPNGAFLPGFAFEILQCHVLAVHMYICNVEREVPKLPYDELLILAQDQTEQLVALKQELEQLKRMLILSREAVPAL